MSNVIVIGDSAQVATYVETILQINATLKEMFTVNQELQSKFDKLNADIATEKANSAAKDQKIAQDAQTIQDLTNQVATLTAADQATTQAVGAAVDAADAALTTP